MENSEGTPDSDRLVLMTDERVLVALRQHGGAASSAVLVDASSRHALRVALREGAIRQDGRGRYSLPVAEDGRAAANRMTGVASHLTAAAHWGWSMKTAPARPMITVPRNRNVPPADQKASQISWRTLPPDDVVDGCVTGPVQTVLDCAVMLPFDEALAVADSALRSGTVTRTELEDAAAAMSRGGPAARRVAREASQEAANPFESVLRAIALGVTGLRVRPQVEIEGDGFFARVDLGDEEPRIALEADSFESHGARRQLAVDAKRYDEIVIQDWLLHRFAWEHVMFEQPWVTRMLEGLVQVRKSRPAKRRRISVKRAQAA